MQQFPKTKEEAFLLTNAQLSECLSRALSLTAIPVHRIVLSEAVNRLKYAADTSRTFWPNRWSK